MSKEINSMFYHAMRENVAIGESFRSHIPTNDNFSDLMTKVLAGQMRQNHVGNILYDIYDEHH